MSKISEIYEKYKAIDGLLSNIKLFGDKRAEQMCVEFWLAIKEQIKEDEKQQANILLLAGTVQHTFILVDRRKEGSPIPQIYQAHSPDCHACQLLKELGVRQ